MEIPLQKPENVNTKENKCPENKNHQKEDHKNIQKTSYSLCTNDLNQKKEQKVKIPLQLAYNKMQNDDLPMTKPNPQIFKTTRFGTNPLDPIYNLPKAEELSREETKFIKDSLNVNDIQGARSKLVDQTLKRQIANINRQKRHEQPDCYVKTQIQEIVFQSIPEKQSVKLFCQPSRSPLDVTDIELPKKFEMSKRRVNPVNPQYFYYTSENQPGMLDPITKSTSSILHKSLNKVSFGLMVNDVLGAQTNTSGNALIKEMRVKGCRQTNFIGDLEFAHPGTHKKGIVTKRMIDPVDPNYKLPESYTKGFYIGSEYTKEKPGWVYKSGKKNFKLNPQGVILSNIQGVYDSQELAPQRFYQFKHQNNDLFNLLPEKNKIEKQSKAFRKSESRNVLLGVNIDEKLMMPVSVAQNEAEFLEKYYRLQKKETILKPSRSKVEMIERNYKAFEQPNQNKVIRGTTAQLLDKFVVKRGNEF